MAKNNLAEVTTRDEQQLEKIGRRDSILPDRRGIRAAAFQPQQDLRSARRGDGGAEALMQTLGLVRKASTDVQNYITEDYAQQEEKNIAAGFVDQQTGRVDTAMMDKSLGYKNAVTKGRTITKFNEASRDFADELEALIEQQDSPDLAERQGAVRARMDQFFKDFAVDPETGQLKDYLQSPGAMRYLAEAMSSTRPKVEAAALNRIEERFNEEALTHTESFITSSIASTGTVDLTQAYTLLPKDIPQEKAAERVRDAIVSGADELRRQGKPAEALALYDALLGSKGKPVNPSVSDAPLGTPSAAPAATGQKVKGRATFDQIASAVMWKESRGNPNAVSPKGAVGTMQTMPTTLTDPGFGVRPAKDNSPAELERVGKDYLKAMLKRYDGDLVTALAAYNAGPGRADEWKKDWAGKSNAQKIASIPFGETKDYVQSILGRLDGAGTSAESDPPSNPTFRLKPLNDDPISQYEATGSAAVVPGLEKVILTAADRSVLIERRKIVADQMRKEWTQARDEKLELNETGMVLRLYGQGQPLTQAEIVQALERGEIRPQGATQLFNLKRQFVDRAQDLADRAAARQTAAEQKAESDAALAASGRYFRRLLAGEAPSAIRSSLLTDLPKLGNTKVQATVINNVLAASNDFENLVKNSQPVRDAARSFLDTETRYAAAVGPRKAENVTRIMNQMQAEFSVRVSQGEDPVKAYTEAASKYKGQLDALLPKSSSNIGKTPPGPKPGQ